MNSTATHTHAILAQPLGTLHGSHARNATTLALAPLAQPLGTLPRDFAREALAIPAQPLGAQSRASRI
jgi:hypothetical protein